MLAVRWEAETEFVEIQGSASMAYAAVNKDESKNLYPSLYSELQTYS